MIREFEEEVGIKTTVDDWKPLIIANFQGGTCYFFWSDTIDIYDYLQMEAEIPVILHLKELQTSKVIPNLKWIINLALDTDIVKPVLVHE